MEKQLFFNSDLIPLFGVIYQPEVPKNKGYLIIHPFAEEKKSSQRTLVEMAEALCREGFYVFIFDLRGCGDSQGNLKEAGVSSWLADINNSLAYFKKATKINKVDIIGLRFGAYLAMLYSYRIEQIKNLILVEPILRPVDYLRKSLRHKLIKELCTDGEISSKRNDLLTQLEENISVDFDGHELSASFYKDLISWQEQYSCDTIIKHLKDGFLVSISLTGKISKDSKEIITINSELSYKTLKMELFWDKVDEVMNDKLINEVVGYCLSNYN